MAADLFAVLDEGAADAAPLVVVQHPGAPRGKGRPRGRIVMPKAGKPFVHFYTDSETEAYETALKWRAKAAMRSTPPFEGPLAVRIFAMMPIPASWSKRDRAAALNGTLYPMTSPDGDNIAKVLDALNKVVFLDDKQVVRWLIVKEYGEHPGLIIEVYRLP